MIIFHFLSTIEFQRSNRFPFSRTTVPTPLLAETIKSRLNSLRLGSEILVFKTVDSTNELARQYLEKDAQEGLVLIAETQTRGRGRRGRNWLSSPEVGLYFSIILKPNIHPQRQPQLTLLAGLATTLAINEFTLQKARLKWPNDILLNGKKCCGILSETHPIHDGKTGVIVGIGINANHSLSDFPVELKTTATSLMIETENEIDRMALVSAVLGHFDKLYDAFLKDEEYAFMEQWLENSDMIGKKITVSRGDSVTCGTALGLDSDGRLLLRADNGEEMVFDSGEVSLQPALRIKTNQTAQS
jgi:BirA family biotin operon repressor/biotin-[acetyl-CoA-carboxylase] ligase